MLESCRKPLCGHRRDESVVKWDDPHKVPFPSCAVAHGAISTVIWELDKSNHR